MLDQVCGGFYIEGDTSVLCHLFFILFEGDSCNLVSDLSKVEKDGKTNNLFQKGGEYQIPEVIE